VPVKSAPGMACRLYCAGCPAETAATNPPPFCAARKLAAGVAVPLTVTVRGELPALSVIVSVVVRTPAASGEKTTEILQDELGDTAVVQVLPEKLKSPTFAPPRVAEET
jgi:hypothetical protein